MTVIKLRRGTSSEWSAANPILALGEPGFERNTFQLKIGDGVTAWNSLPYVAGEGEGGWEDELAAEEAAREAADALLIPLTQRAAANGVATLDSSAKIPANQIDSSNFMTLSATQTVTGDKNFTGALQKSGVDVETTAGSTAKANAAQAASDPLGTATAQVDNHAAATTGVHGVGASTVESVSGAQTKANTAVSTHNALATGVHGVSSGNIESTTGAQTKADAAQAAAIQRANHTGTQLASTISDFNTAVRLNRLDQMAVPTATVNMNNQIVSGAADPVNPQDLTTKAYVDGAAQGLTPKAPVVAATDANITLSGEQTIDSVAVVAGDRVLVKNQSDPTENGIYVASGSTWSRATDADSGAELLNAYTFVTGGTAGGSLNTGWYQSTPATISVGSSNIVWTLFSRAGDFVAGTAMTKVGSTFNVVLGTTSNSAAAGNDSRITGAEQAANKGQASGYMGLDGSSRGAQYPRLHASTHAGGGTDPIVPWNVTSKSSTYTAVHLDLVLASSTFTLTTPAATLGNIFRVKNTSTGTITVAAATGLVDGAATKVMSTQGETIEFVADGTNWHVVSTSAVDTGPTETQVKAWVAEVMLFTIPGEMAAEDYPPISFAISGADEDLQVYSQIQNLEASHVGAYSQTEVDNAFTTHNEATTAHVPSDDPDGLIPILRTEDRTGKIISLVTPDQMVDTGNHGDIDIIVPEGFYD